MANVLNSFVKIKRKVIQTISIGFQRFVGGVFGLIIHAIINSKRQERRKIRERVRVFEPTFTVKNGRTIKTEWRLREAPLTDAQLDELDKY